MEWAGPDAELAEWGMDDVPVLKQNLFLVGLDEQWPARWYDLQRIFLQSYPRQEGEGMTLKSVVERLGIPQDEPFHNALDDALYTVKICRRLPLWDGLAAYPTDDELLVEALNPSSGAVDIQIFNGLMDHDANKHDPALSRVACPVCGKPLTHDEVWLKRGNTGYYTMSRCAVCGPWFTRFKLSRRDGLCWNFARCTEPVTPETEARWNKQRSAAIERMKRKAEKVAQE